MGDIEVSDTTISAVAFVSEMGNDSDSMKDVILDGENYYTLVHEGLTGNTYIAQLEVNFTSVERYELGSIGTPHSFDKMDGLWNVSIASDSGAISIIRFDSDWSRVFQSDFGFIDEHPAVIRAIVDRWSVPNTGKIDIFNRSFVAVESVYLQYDIAPVLDSGTDYYTSISEKRDIIFDFSLDGAVSKAYSLVSRPSSVVNIRRYDGVVLMVEPLRIIQVTI